MERVGCYLLSPPLGVRALQLVWFPPERPSCLSLLPRIALLFPPVPDLHLTLSSFICLPFLQGSQARRWMSRGEVAEGQITCVRVRSWDVTVVGGGG